MLSVLMHRELMSLRERVDRVLELYRRISIQNKPRWIELGNPRKSSAVASDSSFVGTLSRYAFTYAIRAFSALFTGNADDVVRLSRSLVRFDIIELLSGYGESGEGVSMRKGVVHHVAKDLEVEVTRSVIDSMEKPPDLVLFDGSLRSFFYNKFRGGDEFSINMRRSWEKRVDTLKRIFSISRAIFISKSHTRQILYRYLKPEIDGKLIVVPDYALLEKILEGKPRTPGFLEPIRISREEAGFEHVLTYAVLARGSQAYQISIPGNPGVDEISEILAMLRYHSPTGYPEPLRQCHYHSRMKRREFIQLLEAYGIRLESGREALGEV